MSSKIYGGNKVRKMEFVLGDAQRKRRRVLIAVDGTGSNQVLATGIFGRKLGFDVVGVMMDQANAEYVRRNLLLDDHYGVEINCTPSVVTLLLSCAFHYLKLYLLGRRPYYVPSGASSPIGCVGFVNAAFELRRQIEGGVVPEPDYMIVAAGSLGTASGLELGCRLAELKTKVVGVRVAMPWYVTRSRFASMVNRICDFLRGIDQSIPRVRVYDHEVILLGDYLGKGYAWFTDGTVETVSLMKDLEGIPLEHTYTGKALGGGVDWLRRNGLWEKVVLFWNTFNSVDLSHLIVGSDFGNLPKSCHKYFKTPTQEELLSVS